MARDRDRDCASIDSADDERSDSAAAVSDDSAEVPNDSPATEQSGARDDDGTDRAPPRDSHDAAERGAVDDATVSFDEGGRREIELPLRLYKTVTVFSTLIAVVCVVLGFLMLDAATLGGSLLRRGVAGGLATLGIGVAEGTLSALFAVAGLCTIGLGAGVYVLGTRFRAPGMAGKRDEE